MLSISIEIVGELFGAGNIMYVKRLSRISMKITGKHHVNSVCVCVGGCCKEKSLHHHNGYLSWRNGLYLIHSSNIYYCPC